MFYSKKFKIILISLIIVFIILLISIGLVNRSKKIKELQQQEQQNNSLNIENNSNSIISSNNNNIKNNENVNNTSSSVDLPLKDRIELPERYNNMSEEQLEEIDKITKELIGTWTGIDNIFVKYTFTKDTITVELFDDDNSLKESEVYRYELLSDSLMLIEENGAVKSKNYTLTLEKDKATLEPPIKIRSSLLTKDNYVYEETEETTKEEDTTEQSTKSIEEILGIDSNETFDFERFTEFEFTESTTFIEETTFTETTTYESYVTLTTEGNDSEEIINDEEKIVENNSETTTTNQEEFDNWLSDYLKNEKE